MKIARSASILLRHAGSLARKETMWNLIYNGKGYRQVVDKFRTFKEAKNELYNRQGLCYTFNIDYQKIYSIRNSKDGESMAEKRSMPGVQFK
jgi:hypothetical protein